MTATSGERVRGRVRVEPGAKRVRAYLGGDIDAFLETALAQKMSGAGPAKVEDLD